LSEQDDTEPLASFAAEVRHRCGVISIGLEAKTSDLETLRAEADALRVTAASAGLQRLAELAGLMESEFAEAAKRGGIHERRAEQLADAAEALTEAANAALAGQKEPPGVGRSLARLFGA
jgi:endonuclease III